MMMVTVFFARLFVGGIGGWEISIFTVFGEHCWTRYLSDHAERELVNGFDNYHGRSPGLITPALAGLGNPAGEL
jgi:hypothetical protein